MDVCVEWGGGGGGRAASVRVLSGVGVRLVCRSQERSQGRAARKWQCQVLAAPCCAAGARVLGADGCRLGAACLPPTYCVRYRVQTWLCKGGSTDTL